MTDEQFKRLCDKIDKLEGEVTFHALIIILLLIVGFGLMFKSL